eukprot:Rhum_TRINITY_DN14531_c2_g1::Rhum_TRINITY_DN14531_c2_g1_i1::g.97716::m.97716
MHRQQEGGNRQTTEKTYDEHSIVLLLFVAFAFATQCKHWLVFLCFFFLFVVVFLCTQRVGDGGWSGMEWFSCVSRQVLHFFFSFFFFFFFCYQIHNKRELGTKKKVSKKGGMCVALDINNRKKSKKNK